MKKILILPALLLLSGCEKTDKDPFSYEQSAVYSKDGNTTFSSILVEIKPFIVSGGERFYILSPRLDSVQLAVDSEVFGGDPSLSLDTSLYTAQTIGPYRVTGAETKYAAQAWFVAAQKSLVTAGDFSNLLNEEATLEPGHYFVRVASFYVKLADGSSKRVTSQATLPLEVKEGARNAYLGEIEIQVK